jgi:uncharacterized protein (TIGR02118 family)
MKLITLYKRRSGMEVEEFHRQLLESAAAESRHAGITRYVQSHTLVRGYSKGELLFDALSEAWFADEDIDNVRHYAHQARQDRAFLDNQRTHTMLINPYIVKDTPLPPQAVKNIEFVNRRPGMALAAFQDYWRNIHGPLGATIPSILRYEQNHLHPYDYMNDNAPLYDGLAITWFESTAAMRQGAQTPEYERTRADESNFLPDGHLPIIIVREVFDSARR